MSSPLVALVLLCSSVGATALRDVPKGECHGCEVTCFEDCALKYDREIIQTDFLQVSTHRASNLTDTYSKCLVDDQCPCKKDDAKSNSTKITACAVGEVPCAQNCSRKVVSNAEASLKEKATKKTALLQRHYPIHSVEVGVFSKGAMDLDQCVKFCLAATCGCDKAPGLKTIEKLFDAIKQNDAAVPGEKDFSHRGAVYDTHQSAQFKPAELAECAKGMIGKKVTKGLWVDFGEGVGGEKEICSKEFMAKVFGPGDTKKQMDLCASKKSDDMKWGCIWSDVKSACVVGFASNLRCQKKFFDDPSKL